MNIGKEMHELARKLFPICRSITGDGVRETLKILKAYISLAELNIFDVPSGTEAFDWTVPEEWFIRDAYITDESGDKIIDFKSNNLHVVGYSEPVDSYINLDELNHHLHSLPDQPTMCAMA